MTKLADMRRDKFPLELKRRLKAQKYTQKTFSEMLGVRRPTVSSWINGVQYPHPTTMQEIDNLLPDPDEIPDPDPDGILPLYYAAPGGIKLAIKRILKDPYPDG